MFGYLVLPEGKMMIQGLPKFVALEGELENLPLQHVPLVKAFLPLFTRHFSHQSQRLFFIYSPTGCSR
jgi:hypothetical protein